MSMAEAAEFIAIQLLLSEVLEHVSFEKLRPYLHSGRIPAHQHALYLLPSGVKEYQPGSTPPELWFNALLEGGRHGRVTFFLRGHMVEGRVVDEQVFAYTTDIVLDRAAFEAFFPVTTAPVLNWRAGHPGWVRFLAPDKTKPSPEPAEARTTEAAETLDDRPVEHQPLKSESVLLTDTATAEAPQSTTEMRTEEPECKAAEAPQGKHPGGAPEDWYWMGVVPLLKQRKAGEGLFKGKTTFKNMAEFKTFIGDNVRRVRGVACNTKPDRRAVERAIRKYDLEQRATFEEKSSSNKNFF
jgi:hypothetical protein